jgi:hypothetical protein
VSISDDRSQLEAEKRIRGEWNWGLRLPPEQTIVNYGPEDKVEVKRVLEGMPCGGYRHNETKNGQDGGDTRRK